jgi:hypothetical protein
MLIISHPADAAMLESQQLLDENCDGGYLAFKLAHAIVTVFQSRCYLPAEGMLSISFRKSKFPLKTIEGVIVIRGTITVEGPIALGGERLTFGDLDLILLEWRRLRHAPLCCSDLGVVDFSHTGISSPRQDARIVAEKSQRRRQGRLQASSYGYLGLADDLIERKGGLGSVTNIFRISKLTSIQASYETSAHGDVKRPGVAVTMVPQSSGEWRGAWTQRTSFLPGISLRSGSAMTVRTPPMQRRIEATGDTRNG